MSNETKRDVFTRVNNFARDLRVYDSERMESKEEIDRDYQEDMSAYDAALPDDLPVIPKRIGKIILILKSVKMNISQALIYIRSEFNSYNDWSLSDNNSEVFSRAWVLGVWRVEETGEVVKLEAEK